ncbi:GntR family transcriptional regulator [Klebsiella grimontii]|uniref:GntR family transcriptional regulator n=1 Tax=Klebsiella grimontii TaxID=2058152 RepID=UPI0012B77385|nr:GntR family transcriptional regulator [Klebsiella grimontii]MBZ7569089.1 GntR family transcriptional regulator [Klebsiella grimontii]MDT8626173.1 GntR family transcriptional regulator [Klebsiella grimontii]MDU2496635.1 GntR family transcriptional regulator [Klebsiella grimontii]UNF12713.1 GntR family transcriptional regulator [Klebsiella grimontii]
MSQPLLEYIKGRLNAEAPAPLYIQLKQAIEAAMTERLLTHGSILPSERKMSQMLELSRVTVVKALDALLEAGLVIKRHGKGTEVNLPVSYNLASGGFSAQLQNSGTVSNRWLVREKLAADDFLARELEIAVGDRVAKIKRVRLVDALPVSIETMFIPEHFLPRPDLLEGSLYAHWAENAIFPDLQDYSLTVHVPSGEELNLLDLPQGVPLMKITLKSRNAQGEVLEYGTAFCLSNYFNFDFRVKLQSLPGGKPDVVRRKEA